MFKNKNKPWLHKRSGTLTMDRRKITIKQNGREVNLYDLVQSRNIDTEIYPTLYKYGSIKPLEINEEWLTTGLEKLESLKDLDRIQKAAEELFNGLPDTVRREYGNSYSEFYKDKGEKILKKWRKNNEPNNSATNTTNNPKNNNNDTNGETK